MPTLLRQALAPGVQNRACRNLFHQGAAAWKMPNSESKSWIASDSEVHESSSYLNREQVQQTPCDFLSNRRYEFDSCYHSLQSHEKSSPSRDAVTLPCTDQCTVYIAIFCTLQGKMCLAKRHQRRAVLLEARPRLRTIFKFNAQFPRTVL